VLGAVTPEERLLRLIESGEPAGKGFDSFFFPYREKARRLIVALFSGRLAPPELSLALVNRGLIVLLVLAVVAMALNTQRVRPSPMDLSRLAPPAGSPSTEDQALAALPPVETYLQEVARRDLFNPVAQPVAPPEGPSVVARQEPVKPATPTKPPETSPLEVLREKAKTLKLVGIAWGPIPIVMIEDTASRETSFLKEQDTINQIRIKAIFRDRVVISYGNADHDLF
jgi:hypothetical protein